MALLTTTLWLPLLAFSELGHRKPLLRAVVKASDAAGTT